jgi:alkylation response protein AidB-like acyl-CoA dehydrogenase
MLGASATLDARIHPRLREHKEFFEKHVAELKAATNRAILRHRRDIIDRQLVLERLANMAIEMFATACVISRTQSILEARGEDDAQRELALCDLFCLESGLRFRANRDTLGAHAEATDAKRRSVAADIRAAQGYFVQDAILPE